MTIRVLYGDRRPDFSSLGRNGYSLTTGIAVTDMGGEIFLEPINSKGKTSRCRIVVVQEAIPALIQALSKFNPGG